MGDAIVCPICSNTKYTLIEGFYYCTRCQSQSQDFRETEVDRIANPHNLIRTAAHKTKKDDNAKKSLGEKTAVEGINMQSVFHTTTYREGDFPRYLQQVGRRLTTYARMAMQFSKTLVMTFNVPRSLEKVMIYLIQRYYIFHKVAFVPEEITEDGIPGFKFTLRTTLEIRTDLRKKRKERLRLREEARNAAEQESRLADVMSFLNTFEDTQNSTPSRREADDDDDDDDEDPQDPEDDPDVLFKTTQTRLTTEAVIAAGRMRLDVSIMLSMLYLALHLIGVRYITLSDLYRWFREGRLYMTNSQFHGLSSFHDVKDLSTSYAVRRLWLAIPECVSLSDAYRFLGYTAGCLPLPASIPLAPVDLQVNRLFWNLNLPHKMRRQYDTLLRFLGEPFMDASPVELKKRYPAHEDFLGRLMKDTAHRKAFGTTSFFACFYEEDWRDLQKLISPETKLAAVLLLVFKLMYGFDGKHEYGMVHADAGVFDIRRWILQARLRTAAWRGIPMEKIFDKTACTLTTGIAYQRSIMSHFAHYQNARYQRSINFEKCIPVRSFIVQRDKAFIRPSGLDISQFVNYSDEAVYAPMRYHATKRDEVDRLLKNPLLDSRRIKLFFEDYSRQKLDYHPVDVEEQAADSKTKPMVGEKWLKLFPCSVVYKPCPRRSFIKIFHRKKALNKGPLRPVLFNSTSRQFYADLSRDPSFSFFKELVDLVALVIAEDAEVLYAAFLMVENVILNREKLVNLKVDIESRKPFCVGLTSVRNTSSAFLNAEEVTGSKDPLEQKFLVERGKLRSKAWCPLRRRRKSVRRRNILSENMEDETAGEEDSGAVNDLENGLLPAESQIADAALDNAPDLSNEESGTVDLGLTGATDAEQPVEEQADDLGSEMEIETCRGDSGDPESSSQFIDASLSAEGQEMEVEITEVVSENSESTLKTSENPESTSMDVDNPESISKNSVNIEFTSKNSENPESIFKTSENSESTLKTSDSASQDQVPSQNASDPKKVVSSDDFSSANSTESDSVSDADSGPVTQLGRRAEKISFLETGSTVFTPTSKKSKPPPKSKVPPAKKKKTTVSSEDDDAEFSSKSDTSSFEVDSDESVSADSTTTSKTKTKKTISPSKKASKKTSKKPTVTGDDDEFNLNSDSDLTSDENESDTGESISSVLDVDSDELDDNDNNDYDIFDTIYTNDLALLYWRYW